MGIKLSGAQKGKYAVTSILLFSPFTLPPDEIDILKAFGGGQRVHNVVYFLVNQPPLHPYHRHDSHAHYKFPNRVLSPLSPLPLFFFLLRFYPLHFKSLGRRKSHTKSTLHLETYILIQKHLAHCSSTVYIIWQDGPIIIVWTWTFSLFLIQMWTNQAFDDEDLVACFPSFELEKRGQIGYVSHDETILIAPIAYLQLVGFTIINYFSHMANIISNMGEKTGVGVDGKFLSTWDQDFKVYCCLC